MLSKLSLSAGAVLVIVIVFMAVTSSGASEMVAVSSLFTFDVYRRYIKPEVLFPYVTLTYPCIIILTFPDTEEVKSSRIQQFVTSSL